MLILGTLGNTPLSKALVDVKQHQKNYYFSFYSVIPMMRNIPHENNEKNKRWGFLFFFFFFFCPSRGKIMLEYVPSRCPKFRCSRNFLPALYILQYNTKCTIPNKQLPIAPRKKKTLSLDYQAGFL